MTKTLETRLNEIKTIYSKLNELGISESVCKNIKDFKIKANLFVKDGESDSGKIKLFEIDKDLLYIFTINPNIASSVVLKQRK